MDPLAQQIKALRNARNMSQQELATRVGEAQTTISALERGKLELKVKTLCRIAQVFQVDAGELTRAVCSQLDEDAA